MALQQIKRNKNIKAKPVQKSDPGVKAAWVNSRVCPAAKKSTGYIDSVLKEAGT